VSTTDLAAWLEREGAQFHVRGWLSANCIVFAHAQAESSVIVDTGYASHAALTVGLAESSLGGRALDRIINTHLHSDHCGGNAALQACHMGVRTAVPSGYQHALEPWDPERLSYRETGQRCESFTVDEYIAPGGSILLGTRQWEVHAAGGHDPDALMFFEPIQRVLISGDALWEHRLAIIFPELTGTDGFGAAGQTLDRIERLAPRLVLPGHGEGFTCVTAALAQSRRRLNAMAAAPSRHRDHAARALAMFHMLEVRQEAEETFLDWMTVTPIFAKTFGPGGQSNGDRLRDYARDVISGLIEDRLLLIEHDLIKLAQSPE
jgi:glyoxylase-like metal-dependent hydrolase (beta-lactamase superfamily II)